MTTPSWPREAFLLIAAGLSWLTLGTRAGLLAFVLVLLPGLMLVSTGTSTLLWPGDRRATHFAALGAATGLVLGLFAWPLLGLWPGAIALLLSLAGFAAAGSLSNLQEPVPAGVPAAPPSAGLSLRTAIDEGFMAHLQFSLRTPDAAGAERIREELLEARELFTERGWLEKPESYHLPPPTLEDPCLRPARFLGQAYEHLSFESEYEPHPEEPGRERWLGYAPNRTGHAYVMRHREGRPRPWIVCINGYRTGMPFTDIPAFGAGALHEKLGLNVLIPVLPLHGPRKIGRQSGDGFMDGEALDMIHAEAQAIWDCRRLLSWARAQGDAPVGLQGLSLGAYTASLLASVQEGLACVIAGIPVADFPRIIWQHGPASDLLRFESAGLTRELVAEVMRPIAPLEIAPKVPLEGRAIFAGCTDRIVPPDHQRDLFEHWERPRMQWYAGGHLSFAFDRRVGQLVRDVLRETLLPAPLARAGNA